jgi:hypothetical protein
MKKSFKMLVLAGVIGLLALTACATAAAQSPVEAERVFDVEVYPTDMDAESAYEDDFVFEWAAMPEFLEFRGVITEIRPFYDFTEEGEVAVEGKYYVLVESSHYTMIENGEFEEMYVETVNFVVDQGTLLLPDVELELGMPITGFYESNLPVILIYPPQHHARVLVNWLALSDSFSDVGSYVVDRFDADLKAFYHPLQLVINVDEDDAPETEIIFEDGLPFEGDLSELENRALVVLSGPLPTPVYDADDDADQVVNVVPHKIIILFERAVPPILFLTEEELAMIENGEFIQPDDSWHGGLLLTQEDLDIMWDNMLDPETVQVIVNGEAVEMPTPFINREAGFVMVPVAYIAEALGYPVVGEGEELMIGLGTTFTIGVDSYFIARMAPIELGAAPEMHDGVIFVPLHFFGQVFPDGGYVMDGNIFVTSFQVEDILD